MITCATKHFGKAKHQLNDLAVGAVGFHKLPKSEGLGAYHEETKEQISKPVTKEEEGGKEKRKKKQKE